MLRVGLTGGIGSGKTTVAKLFALLGVPVYNADDASKRLYATDPVLAAALKEHFGEEVYAGGTLNRPYLASLVFGDEEKLALLNSLVHPPTLRDAEAWMARQSAPYIVKEAALLFESGSAGSLDYIIGVSAPKHLRLHRAMQRDGATRDAVLARMSRQVSESLKLRLCDFVIANDEGQPLMPQVLAVHEELLGKGMENL